MSDFFTPPPPRSRRPERPLLEPPWCGPPAGTLPGVLPLELALAHTQKAVIFITHLEAYATGFEFDVHAATGSEDAGFGLEIFGRHWPALGQRRDELPPELLRIGVEFPDGGKATNIEESHFHHGPGAPDAPVMSARGGSGGSHRWHQAYWIWPLPQPGELQFVCEWPALDIPLTRVPLDAQLLLDAAQRARVIFPE